MEEYQRIVDKPLAGNMYPIPFVVTIGANVQGGLAISIVRVPYTVLGATIYFSDVALDNVLVYFLHSSEGNISTTGVSTGDNLFSPMAGTPFFIGHADAVNVSSDITPPIENTYIKMHVVNNNAYAVTIMGVLNIRL